MIPQIVPWCYIFSPNYNYQTLGSLMGVLAPLRLLSLGPSISELTMFRRIGLASLLMVFMDSVY